MRQKKGITLFTIGLCSCFLLTTIFFILAGSEKAYGDIKQGEKLFMAYCAVCHGEKGDSKGQAYFSMSVEPGGRKIRTYSRDFTIGVFKFRSTPTGCLPLEEDVLNIITNGIAKSFMPAFRNLSDERKRSILEYIQSLSERWEEEDPCDPIVAVKPPWVGSPESVIKGEKVFNDMKCWECHGKTGKGDGVKSHDLKDDWGHKIVPFDFTSGDLKRGTSPEAIYMTFSTGLDGSGMPSYEDTLPEEERWHLVSYTLKLMGR